MNSSLVCIDVYTVCAGDTVSSVAEKYALPSDLLMRANGLEDHCDLQAGMRLCIPGTPDRLPEASDRLAPAPEKSFLTHEVAAGDTLYLIAKKHGVKLGDLMRANPSVDPYNLRIGSKLCIPH